MKEINVLEGKVVAKKGMKAAIVAARFNEIIVNKLLGGAVDGLVRHGVEEENMHGYREHLKFRLWQSVLQNPESMMRLSVSVQLFEAIPAIMIMCAMKFQKELQQSDYRQECRCYLA
mgnify:CR=1 FL=1